MPASKAQRAKTAERRAKAIAMLLAGVDYDTITQRLGYATRGAATKDVQRALEANRAAERESVEELRTVDLMRLDRLQAAVWTKALGGDPRVVETVLKILERRAKLLGLDAVVKQELNATVTSYQVDLGDGDAAKAALT
jgi:hypothetical protein